MRNKYVLVAFCVLILFITSANFIGLSASPYPDSARIQALESQLETLKADYDKLSAGNKSSFDRRVSALENKTQYIQINRANDGATRFSGRESTCGFIIHGNGQYETYC